LSASAPASAHENSRLTTAESLLGHNFSQPDLLAEALTHRSAASGRARKRARGAKRPRSNERLEFLGDRVLGLVVAEWLAERFPNEQEGQLGLRFAHLVSRETVADVANTIGLDQALNIGNNEAIAGVGRLSTVLADAMEAAIGALYLDGGLDPARRFIRQTWSALLTAQIKPPKDPKTALQERLAILNEPPPTYLVANSTGPSHSPHFTITVSGAGHTGTGEGTTKRTAERAAAADLLGRLS
jgi:ribonuclease-3